MSLMPDAWRPYPHALRPGDVVGPYRASPPRSGDPEALGVRRWSRAVHEVSGAEHVLLAVARPGRSNRDNEEWRERTAARLLELEDPDLLRVHHVGVMERVPNGHGGTEPFALRYIAVDPAVLEPSFAIGAIGASGSGEALPLEEALEVLAMACRAIGRAHARGAVAQPDPSGILVPPGKPPIVAAFAFDPVRAAPGALAYHPDEAYVTDDLLWMAPERLRGLNGGPPADVYALGAMLYCAVTGAPPFAPGPTVIEFMVRAATRGVLEPPSVRVRDRFAGRDPSAGHPDVPEALDRICLQALARNPTDRYPNADALADDLCRLLFGEPVQARPLPGPSFLQRLAAWTRPRAPTPS